MRLGPLPALGFALGSLAAAGVSGGGCARLDDAGTESEVAEPGVVGAEPRVVPAERSVLGAEPGGVAAEPGVVAAEPGAAREREAAGRGNRGECAPPTISLRGAWRRPAGHEWASRAELAGAGTMASPSGTAGPANPGAPGSRFETLGRIEVASVFRLGTTSATSCLAGRCLVCPPEVEGVFGYEFHRILLARELADSACHREAALEHELLHADLYAEAERNFLPPLRERLRTRLSGLTPVTTAKAGTEGVQARWQEALEEEIAGAVERMNRETDARQALLDTGDAYRRWSAETESRCGPFPASAAGRR